MRTLTLEAVYRNGLIELPKNIKFKHPMRVLVVFLDETKPEKYIENRFSFAKSLRLTKNCKGTISDIIINERRNEKW